MKLFKALIAVVVLLSFSQARADDLREFLLSCGYGTLIGATLGLATVAVADNPSGKLSNIARGASLGLYFGIGMGLYSVSTNRNSYQTQNQPSVWFVPSWNQQRQIEGVAVNSIIFQF
jgi:hypothetical protein